MIIRSAGRNILVENITTFILGIFKLLEEILTAILMCTTINVVNTLRQIFIINIIIVVINNTIEQIN